MIVTDNTVLVDFWMGEPDYKKSAKQLLMEDSEWLAPSIWQYEFCFVLQKYERRGGLASTSKYSAIELSQQMVKTVYEIDLQEIERLAEKTGLKFYDASYVWLAASRGLKLFTRDKQIIRACPAHVGQMP